MKVLSKKELKPEKLGKILVKETSMKPMIMKCSNEQNEQNLFFETKFQSNKKNHSLIIIFII